MDNQWKVKTPPPPVQKKPLKLKKFEEKPDDPFAPFSASDSDDICVGMTVEHQRFGLGKVLSVEGKGPNKKTTVLFDGVGTKQLLVQYAKLRIVS